MPGARSKSPAPPRKTSSTRGRPLAPTGQSIRTPSAPRLSVPKGPLANWAPVQKVNCIFFIALVVISLGVGWKMALYETQFGDDFRKRLEERMETSGQEPRSVFDLLQFGCNILATFFVQVRYLYAADSFQDMNLAWIFPVLWGQFGTVMFYVAVASFFPGSLHNGFFLFVTFLDMFMKGWGAFLAQIVIVYSSAIFMPSHLQDIRDMFSFDNDYLKMFQTVLKSVQKVFQAMCMLIKAIFGIHTPVKPPTVGNTAIVGRKLIPVPPEHLG